MKVSILLLAVLLCNLCLAQKDTLKEKLIATLKLEAKPVYIKASSDIAELREDISLAKRSLISKAKVVKRYNDLVGPTMGMLTSFDAVDKKLQKAEDAYVIFMFDKEIARLAREKAASAKFEAEN